MNSSIWPIDGTLTDTTLLGQSGPRSDGNEGVLHIPQDEVARDVMVIVVGNGHGDTSSNPGQGLIAFHVALIPLGKVWIQLFSLQLWVNSRADWVL